ncbi:ROK family protein [Diaminobutyricibacter sp. McL0618]|uniref:ROK family transcriptional regulator n=1 Tax=Leifsonia sp. McL0618 TaxID=3415677 RepID=UPI003CFA21C3
MADSPNGLASADVRRHNLSIMMRHLASAGPSSRSDLAEQTGLKRGSITPLVQILHEAGLVRETTSVVGARGRPRTNLELTGEHIGLLVLQIASDEITGVVTTLGGAEVARQSVAHHAAFGDPDTVLDASATVIASLIETAKAAACDIVDATIVTQSPVGGEPSRVLGDAHMGWASVDVLGALRRRVPELTRVRFQLSSDAPLAALAELRRIGTPGHAIFIKGDNTTIGGALVVAGEVVEGAHGFGGSLGHLAVVPGGLQCECGQQGCLVTVAGLEALSAQVEPGSSGMVPSLSEFVTRIRSGDPAASAAWNAAVPWIARALEILSMAIDPAVIVVGGQWAPLADSVEAAFRGNRPFAARSGELETLVIPGLLSADAALIGGIEGAQQRVLGDPEKFL